LTGFDAIPQSKLELESFFLLFSAMRARYAVILASASRNPHIGYRKKSTFFEKRIMLRACHASPINYYCADIPLDIN